MVYYRQEVIKLKINKAIRDIMKLKNMSLSAMATAVGKSKGNDISARLNNDNMSFDKVVEMLDVLGYEVVLQERKQGGRRADQIVIDQKEEE